MPVKTFYPGNVEAADSDIVKLYDNVAFSAIPSWDIPNITSAFNHLKIVLQARGSTAASEVLVFIRFNNDSGTNYDGQRFLFYGTTTATQQQAFASTGAPLCSIPGSSASTGRASNDEFLISNYKNTNFHKFIIGSGTEFLGVTASDMRAEVTAGGWRNTAAINRITILPETGNFEAGSHLTIYGLK